MITSFVLQAHLLQSLPFRMIGILVLLFFAILFLQSGIDKVTDRKGNLDWLVGHFSKSIFRGSVPMLLSVLTMMELISGIASLGTAVYFAFAHLEEQVVPFCVVAFCALTLLVLFMGQRIAKDYGGAAGIVPYFILSLISMGYFSIFIFLEP